MLIFSSLAIIPQIFKLSNKLHFTINMLKKVKMYNDGITLFIHKLIPCFIPSFKLLEKIKTNNKRITNIIDIRYLIAFFKEYHPKNVYAKL